jgi:hypothetical protein
MHTFSNLVPKKETSVHEYKDKKYFTVKNVCITGSVFEHKVHINTAVPLLWILKLYDGKSVTYGCLVKEA